MKQRAAYSLVTAALSILFLTLLRHDVFAQTGLGLQIVFTSDREGSGQLYIMDPDGSNPRILVAQDQRSLSPSCSPSGADVLFTSLDPFLGNSLTLVNREGTNARAILSHDYLMDESSWHPNSQQLAFYSEQTALAGIYTMNLSTLQPVLISQNAYLPAWSPDGAKIAFVSVRDGNTEIYVMNADGSNVRQLTNNQNSDNNPCWLASLAPTPASTSTRNNTPTLTPSPTPRPPVTALPTVGPSPTRTPRR